MRMSVSMGMVMGMIMGMVMVVMSVSDSLDVSVVSDLRLSDLRLEPRNRLTILAQRAIHGVVSAEDSRRSLKQNVGDRVVDSEIRRRQNLNLGMRPSGSLDGVVDSGHEDSREQKVGKHDHPRESEHARPLESRVG